MASLLRLPMNRPLVSAVAFFLAGIPVGLFTPGLFLPFAANLSVCLKFLGAFWPLFVNAVVWACAFASPAVLALSHNWQPFVAWRVICRGVGVAFAAFLFFAVPVGSIESISEWTALGFGIYDIYVGVHVSTAVLQFLLVCPAPALAFILYLSLSVANSARFAQISAR